MDRRSRSHWRRARHNYNDLCPPIGRRAAAALLWLSCSIALLRALATSNTRAQRAAARRTFLNAHHRSAAPVAPEPPNSESDPEEPEQEEVSRPECPGYEQGFNYESETESESDLESDIDFDTETETAPTTEPETEPEDERGPVVPIESVFAQSLTQRLQALRVRSPDASPNRAQPRGRQELRTPRGAEPQPAPRDPRDPEESVKPKKEKQQQQQQQQRSGCKPKKPTRRDPPPRSPPRRGPIPIRRF